LDHFISKRSFLFRVSQGLFVMTCRRHQPGLTLKKFAILQFADGALEDGLSAEDTSALRPAPFIYVQAPPAFRYNQQVKAKDWTKFLLL
jgi:hypothetical protein